MVVVPAWAAAAAGNSSFRCPLLALHGHSSKPAPCSNSGAGAGRSCFAGCSTVFSGLVQALCGRRNARLMSQRWAWLAAWMQNTPSICRCRVPLPRGRDTLHEITRLVGVVPTAASAVPLSVYDVALGWSVLPPYVSGMLHVRRRIDQKRPAVLLQSALHVGLMCYTSQLLVSVMCFAWPMLC